MIAIHVEIIQDLEFFCMYIYIYIERKIIKFRVSDKMLTQSWCRAAATLYKRNHPWKFTEVSVSQRRVHDILQESLVAIQLKNYMIIYRGKSIDCNVWSWFIYTVTIINYLIVVKYYSFAIIYFKLLFIIVSYANSLDI